MSPPPTPPNRPRSPYAGLAVGYIPVAALLLGMGLGWLADRASGCWPLWSIVLTVIFLIAGIYHLVREGSR